MKLFKILAYVLFLFFSTMFLSTMMYAEKVEITSDEMHAESAQKEVHFLKNVKINQLENWIHADKVIVYFDENNETNKYEALGMVKFEFKNKEHHYKGSTDKLVYLPIKSKYILTGKAIIDDIANKRHIIGDKIFLDMLSGNIKVQGNKKKPVKFIFDMENTK